MTLDKPTFANCPCPTLYIGTSERNGWRRVSTFAWRIEDAVSRLIISSLKLPVQQIAGDPTKALHPAIMEALGQVPGSIDRAILVTSQESFLNVARRGLDGRRKSEYQLADGSGPLADAGEWEALDAYCEGRGLTLIFSSPQQDYQKASMKLVQKAARRNREFLDCGAVV